MKTATAPKQTSSRKRPSKSFIKQMVEFAGHMTSNQRTQLATLEVKNRMAKINTRAMSDDKTFNFTTAENTEIQKLIKEFVKSIDMVIKKASN